MFGMIMKKINIHKKSTVAEKGNWFDLGEEKWKEFEGEGGQLSVDIYETPTKLIVKSTIAGTKPEDIKISLQNDMLIIKGSRHLEEKIKDEDYLFRECYWGAFSRSVILPVEVEKHKINATMENGVLTIELPKAKKVKDIRVKHIKK
jgi:HSP20 family protein